jgi:hypothetical protein
MALSNSNTASNADHSAPDDPDTKGSRVLGRRRFLTYLVAGPTLAVAARLTGEALDPPRAEAAIPTLPGLAEIVDVQVLAAHLPKFTFNVNGRPVSVDAPADLPMLWVLRDKLGIHGPKYGCGINVCKACTSHLDGKAFNPCVTAVSECAGRNITTIEGLANGESARRSRQRPRKCDQCMRAQVSN